LLFQNPVAAASAALQLPQGPAAVKRAVAGETLPDPATLPLRNDLIALLQAEKACGRALHLVSAADQAIVDAVAAELPLFASATGSDGHRNLKAERKRDYVRDRFPDGFLYAGDSAADLPVFGAARGVV